MKSLGRNVSYMFGRNDDLHLILSSINVRRVTFYVGFVPTQPCTHVCVMLMSTYTHAEQEDAKNYVNGLKSVVKNIIYDERKNRGHCKWRGEAVSASWCHDLVIT